MVKREVAKREGEITQIHSAASSHREEATWPSFHTAACLDSTPLYMGGGGGGGGEGRYEEERQEETPPRLRMMPLYGLEVRDLVCKAPAKKQSPSVGSRLIDKFKCKISIEGLFHFSVRVSRPPENTIKPYRCYVELFPP